MKLAPSITWIIGLALAYGQPPAPTLTTLYSFAGGNDGIWPSGALTRDGKGVLYGATFYGGERDSGTVFKLTPPAAGATRWTEGVLYTFQGELDGADPYGPVVLDSFGNLYGTTFQGGAYGEGTVFELSPPAGNTGQWTKSILFNFDPSTGLYQPTGLISDSAGNLYGTAYGYQGSGGGGVFELSPNPWTPTTLYLFGAKGGSANALAIDASGNLYGTTNSGGVDYDKYHGYLGTVYELSPPSEPQGEWTYGELYAFPSPASGYQPLAALAIGAGGILYGTTTGNSHGPSTGDVFQLSPPSALGRMWNETILHSFYGPDGGSLYGPVAFDTKGNLYGTTLNNADTTDCKSGCGTVFKLLAPTADGGPWASGWTIKFDNSDGWYPHGNLVIRADGTVYGVTYYGGQYGYGTVYQIQP
jgi:uncharacterized repeat protein (TIGR03803 family)